MPKGKQLFSVLLFTHLLPICLHFQRGRELWQGSFHELEKTTQLLSLPKHSPFKWQPVFCIYKRGILFDLFQCVVLPCSLPLTLPVIWLTQKCFWICISPFFFLGLLAKVSDCFFCWGRPLCCGRVVYLWLEDYFESRLARLCQSVLGQDTTPHIASCGYRLAPMFLSGCVCDCSGLFYISHQGYLTSLTR